MAKNCAAGALYLRLVDQHQIGLVSQRRRLQSVIPPLTVQMKSGQPAQLVIHAWRELFCGGADGRSRIHQRMCRKSAALWRILGAIRAEFGV